MSEFKRSYLVAILKENVAEVTFTKKNGDKRVMTCTLIDSKLPVRVVKEGAKERPVNEDVVAVYDLKAEGWRSFRVDSVSKVQPDGTTDETN
jgi:hypothetical protein